MLLQTIRESLRGAVGDIVFGMEDGAVSIFGLVFGVAASANASQVVLLAGATGAVAAAVSMMAGSYLEFVSIRDQARAELAHEKHRIEQHTEEEKKEITERLRAAGFEQHEIAHVLDALLRNPATMLQFEAALDLQLGKTADESPWTHAFWMFVSDLVAAAVPVIPFALFPLDIARIVSLTLTALLLTLLGIGRGVIARRNVVLAVIETLFIAALAAGAGIVMGKLVGGVGNYG